MKKSYKVLIKIFLFSFGIYMCLLFMTIFMFNHFFDYIKNFIINLSLMQIVLISSFFSIITTFSFIHYIVKNKDRILKRRREMKNAEKGKQL